MADVKYTPQEVVEVRFVTAIANTATPTAAELNAGTRITQFLVDGPPNPAGSNFVDAGTLESGFETQVPSTYGGGSGTMTVLRIRDTADTDDVSDVAYNLFPRGTVGFIVVAPYGVGGAAFAFAIGDDVSIYPIEVANRGVTISRGQLMSAAIDVAFTGLPVENVAVT